MTAPVTPPAHGQTPLPAPATKSSTRVFWDRVRRGAAGLVVLVGGILLLAGQVADVCRDEVAESTVVQVCEPMGMTDPRLLWVLLVVLLLLLPDVSEFELAGVLSLKRAVEHVEGQAEQLRTEAHRLQLTANQLNMQMSLQANSQRMGQGQNMYVFPGGEVPANFASFFNDLDSNDTTPLTPAEEAGGIASLAFRSAMTGLLSELFGRWKDRAELIGWVVQEDGSFGATYLMDAVRVELKDWVGAEVAAAEPSLGTFAVEEDGVVAVTTFVTTSLEAGPVDRRNVLGALTVLVTSPEPATEDDLVDLGGRVEAAAEAYGLLLQRVLGEPSTLEGPA